jgi:PPOX class probable F420-dependent enzyme
MGWAVAAVAHFRAIVMIMDLADFERIGAQDQYLAVVATGRADATAQASVVNAGVLPHPVSGEAVVAFVTYGSTKLRNLRQRPWATVVFRSGWQWGTVEGPCELVGPDDTIPGFESSGVPALLRSVFQAAGGTHSDWDEFDRAMRDERRTAVLVRPERIYSNRG